MVKTKIFFSLVMFVILLLTQGCATTVGVYGPPAPLIYYYPAPNFYPSVHYYWGHGHHYR